MKKVIVLLAALLVLAPISASALQMMSDANLKDVTGQAGVSIAIDDVVIYQQSIADTTYWDTDGNGEAAGNSYGIEISYGANSHRLTTIDAIYNMDPEGLGSNYTAAAMEGYGFTGLDGAPLVAADFTAMELTFGLIGAHALSIDVGNCSVLTAGNTFNAGSAVPVAGVVIGLPTVEIVQYHSDNRRAITLRTEDAAVAANANATFIEIEKSGTSKMAILGGTVEIAPH
jgi:hypothetical protein